MSFITIVNYDLYLSFYWKSNSMNLGLFVTHCSSIVDNLNVFTTKTLTSNTGCCSIITYHMLLLYLRADIYCYATVGSCQATNTVLNCVIIIIIKGAYIFSDGVDWLTRYKPLCITVRPVWAHCLNELIRSLVFTLSCHSFGTDFFCLGLHYCLLIQVSCSV